MGAVGVMVAVVVVVVMLGGVAEASGPLRVHPQNPRYFTDGSGKAVYLTGSHTWWNLQDRGEEIAPPFDYNNFLDTLARHNHNFFRLWVWEQAAWVNWAPPEALFRFSPLPYLRTGPGCALDGGLRFDVTRFNEAYFDRLRSRVAAASERGFYVAVMLFQGFSIEMKGRPKTNGNPWQGHPFNRTNNINGIDGDPEGTGEGRDVHSLKLPEITALQEAYVRKVIDTVNDLDNVLYEISNESPASATDWQYHMIDFIHEYESHKAKQHPVLMTVPYPEGRNDVLFSSPAEAISPNPGPDDLYRQDPPAADGSKVIITDTDHLWGIGGNVTWVWKSFTRGLNPIFMDPWEPSPLREQHWDEAAKALDTDGIRRALGYTRRYALKMDLAGAQPLGELASTGYCLAKPGSEYLVFQPAEGAFTVDLTAGSGKEFASQWCDPKTGETRAGQRVAGGAVVSFEPPSKGPAVLYLKVR